MARDTDQRAAQLAAKVVAARAACFQLEGRLAETEDRHAAQLASLQAELDKPRTSPPALRTPDNVVLVHDPKPETPRRVATTYRSRNTRSAGDRLTEAVAIVRRRPDINGPELREELARSGWTVSDRTASRILTGAREHSLASVSG